MNYWCLQLTFKWFNKYIPITNVTLKYSKMQTIIELGGTFIGIHSIILLNLYWKHFMVKSWKEKRDELLICATIWMTLKSIAVNKRGTRLQIARFHSAIGKKGKTIRTKSDHWFPVAGLGGEVLSLKNRRNIPCWGAYSIFWLWWWLYDCVCWNSQIYTLKKAKINVCKLYPSKRGVSCVEEPLKHKLLKI